MTDEESKEEDIASQNENTDRIRTGTPRKSSKLFHFRSIPYTISYLRTIYGPTLYCIITSNIYCILYFYDLNHRLKFYSP